MNKMRELRRALRSCVGQIVAFQIREGYGASIAPLLESVIRGERVTDSEFFNAMADDDLSFEQRVEVAEKLAGPLIIPAGRGGKATALVSVRGVALYDVEFQPFAFSTLKLSQTVTALANDPEIGTIVLDIDTPGGAVTGTQEAADAIFAARKNAKVVALVNPLCASAGYWIASQAQEIAAVPSADVGSVGVFMLHAECSKMLEAEGVKPTFIFAKDSPFKVEGNPLEPLSDDAKEYLQGEVDTIMAAFAKGIARGRGIPVSKVLSDFGQGRCMLAPAAKAAGLIDSVAPINQAMARWGVSAATLEGRRRGEDVSPEPAAEVEVPEPAADDVDAPVEMLTSEIPEPEENPADDDGGILYAKVDGPPDNWNQLAILNIETGEQVPDVLEVSADEGWVMVHVLSAKGHPMSKNDEVIKHRIEGNFKIVLRSELPEGTKTAEPVRLADVLGQDPKRHRTRQLALHRHR